MLAHELAHLKRRDLWWAWLPTTAGVLFWFHPLAWLAQREWRLAQEMACDELALLTTEAPALAYGQVVLKVAAEGWGPRLAEPAAVGAAGSYHTRRRRLAALPRVRPVPRRRWRLVGTLLTVIGIAGVVPWRVTAQETKPVRATAARSIGRPFRVAPTAEQVRVVEVHSHGQAVARDTERLVPAAALTRGGGRPLTRHQRRLAELEHAKRVEQQAHRRRLAEREHLQRLEQAAHRRRLSEKEHARRLAEQGHAARQVVREQLRRIERSLQIHRLQARQLEEQMALRPREGHTAARMRLRALRAEIQFQERTRQEQLRQLARLEQARRPDNVQGHPQRQAQTHRLQEQQRRQRLQEDALRRQLREQERRIAAGERELRELTRRLAELRAQAAEQAARRRRLQEEIRRQRQPEPQRKRG